MTRAVLDDKGKVVFVEDDEAEKRDNLTRKQKLAEGSTRKSAGLKDYVNYGADLLRSAGETSQGLVEGLARGATVGLLPRIEGAVAALGSAIPGDEGGRGVKDTYERQRQLSEDRYQQAGELAPIARATGEFVGSVATPAKGAGTGIRLLQAARKGKDVGMVAKGVAGGLGAGGLYGAVAGAAGAPDLTDIPDALSRTALGGAIGGTLGAATGGVGAYLAPKIVKGARGLYGQYGPKDAIPGTLGKRANLLGMEVPTARATRRALAKEQAQLVRDRAQRRVVDTLEEGGTSGAKADEKIQGINAQGGVGRLVDVNRASTGQAKALYDTGTPGAEQFSETLADRATTRGGRFKEFVSKLSGIGSKPTVEDEILASKNRAKIMAATDYVRGGPMDEPVKGISEIAKFFKDNKADVTELAGKARTGLTKHEEKPPVTVPVTGPNGQVQQHETLVFMDAILREYRDKVNNLFARGEGRNTNLAKAYESQMNRLSEILKRNNPDWADVLGRHANEFREQRALEAGERVARSMVSNPRKAWGVIRRAKPEDREALRKALADQLFGKSDTQETLPIAVRKMLIDDKQPESQQIIGFLLGGDASKKLPALRKWIETEIPMMRAESALGKQSITSFGERSYEALRRGEASGAASTGRAMLGALTDNPAMFASNAANAVQRKMQKMYLKLDQQERTRMFRELSKTRKPGEIEQLIKNLEGRELTRKQRLARGIGRSSRATAQAGAGFTEGSPDYE